MSELSVMVHPPSAGQVTPLHPANRYPLPATVVRVILAPSGRLAVHVAGQAKPPWSPRTAFPPTPPADVWSILTVSVWVTGALLEVLDDAGVLVGGVVFDLVVEGLVVGVVRLIRVWVVGGLWSPLSGGGAVCPPSLGPSPPSPGSAPLSDPLEPPDPPVPVPNGAEVVGVCDGWSIR